MFPFYDLFSGDDDYSQGYNKQRRNQQYDDDSDYDNYNQYYNRFSPFDPYGYRAAKQREQERMQKRMQEEKYRKMMQENERRKQQAAYEAYMREQERQQREYQEQMRKQEQIRRYKEAQRQKLEEEQQKQNQQEIMRQLQKYQQLYKEQQEKNQQKPTLYDYFINSRPTSDQDEGCQIDENQIHSDIQSNKQQTATQEPEQLPPQNPVKIQQKEKQQNSNQREKCDVTVLKQASQSQSTLLPTYEPVSNITFTTYDKQAVQQPELNKLKALDYDSAQHMTQDINNSYITIQDCVQGEVPQVEAYGGSKNQIIVSYNKQIEEQTKQQVLSYILPVNYDRSDIQATRPDEKTFLITVPHQNTDDKILINFQNVYKEQNVQTEVKESQTEQSAENILEE